MRKRILMVAAVLGGAVLMSRGPIIPERASAGDMNAGDASRGQENAAATNSLGSARAPAAGNTEAHVGTAMDPPAVSNNTVAAVSNNTVAAVSNNTVAAVTDDTAAVGPRISRESMHPAVESPHPEIEHHAAGVGGGTLPTTGTPGFGGVAPLGTPAPSTGASGFAGVAPLVTPVPSGGGGSFPASRS